jgi:Rieske Fe-S protein
VKPSAVSRRTALSGAATVGLGLPLLAACGDDGGGADAGSTPASDPSRGPSSPAAPPSGPPATAPAPAGGAPGEGLLGTADVPVGGGVVIGDREVVITQPRKGEFRAFTAICTHRGCTVGGVTDTINCPCHGSTFSIEDGSPTGGPAPSPLAEVPITVVGDQISLA